MTICSVCKTIKFEDLPYEEDSAVLHHASLDALKQSSKTCSLCKVIFLSIAEFANVMWLAQQHSSAAVEKDMGALFAGLNHKPKVMSFQGFKADSPYGRETMFAAKEGGPHKFKRYEGYWGLDNGEFTGPSWFKEPSYMEPSDVFGAKGLRPYLFGNWWESTSGRRQLIGLGVRVGTSPRPEDGVGNSESMVHMRGSSYRFRVVESSPLSGLIPGRLKCNDSSRPKAMERLQGWMQTCDAKHTCRPRDAPLPTRLLEIEQGNARSMRVLETANIKTGKYIALSHCWGLSHRLKTTKANIEAHKNGISLSTLPQTFRDAVSCALELGVRWLWIDTLCIIQDDEADWIREAAVMGSVYSNAYLTISAAASTDDSCGIFTPAENRMYNPSFKSADAYCHGRPGFSGVAPGLAYAPTRPEAGFVVSSTSANIAYPAPESDSMYDEGVNCLFLSPEWMPSSTRSGMVTYEVGAFGQFFDPLDGQPLSKRGWTFQERLLSRRSLHYASDQMYFECLEGIAAEDGASFPPWSRRMPQLKHLPLNEVSEIPGITEISRKLATAYDVEAPRADIGGQATTIPANTWRWAWNRLVEDYSRRVFTRSEDKLPALGGLAQAIARLTSDRYVAGHWESILLETLRWGISSIKHVYAVTGGVRDRNPHELVGWQSPVSYPKSYRAPSWSWASIDAEIAFPRRDPEGRFMARVVDCKVDTETQGPFGRVSGGWIKIRGPFFAVHQVKDASSKRNVMKLHHCQGEAIDYGNATVEFDEKGGNDYCNLYAVITDSFGGLLLRSRGMANRRGFTRVGLVVAHDSRGEGDEVGVVNLRHAFKSVMDASVEEMERATDYYLLYKGREDDHSANMHKRAVDDFNRVLITASPWWTRFKDGIAAQLDANSPPMARDTRMTEKYQFLIVTFVADDPGVWALHCHNDFHAKTGMFKQIVERPQAIRDQIGT
ncbi:heterokaryon incompatibility protein-domain-containing protein [Cercophora newfieldiana]|uniref:Heterokaryon incompatibility protein-domain-containing protein n=1 Tax=Cercophora newfieldiana TaxID=92897 RepID=A0AA39YJ09_9PEZI|nr:heterokaryon incompatibility protein-domain-containing protein [Cercophora newfieldiana]